MGDVIGLFMLVLAAGVPFIIAMKVALKPAELEEPRYRAEGSGITAYPICLHCGWCFPLDVTDHVDAAARMEKPTIMKPLCGQCGRRFKVNLTALTQKRRAGDL